MDDEAAHTGRDRGEIDRRRQAARLSEDDIALARVGPIGTGDVGIRRADDDVVESIAVDVAGSCDGIGGTGGGPWGVTTVTGAEPMFARSSIIYPSQRAHRAIPTRGVCRQSRLSRRIVELDPQADLSRAPQIRAVQVGLPTV